jgi:hypothetical protein
LALGQTPQVAIFSDLRPTWFVRAGETNRIRWFDYSGHYSLVGFHMVLETGNVVKVAQRLEKINNDGDPDAIDEAFIEARGLWRIGKQYIPFGQQKILRESVPAIRYDTELLFDAIPISIAVSDNVDGYARGVIARIGGDLGVSVAVGDHFGIQGSSLTQFRRPEEGPGRNHGYHRAVALDTKYGIGGGVLEAEMVFLSDGHTGIDEDRSLSDVRFRFATKGTNYPTTIAWSRSWDEKRDWYSVSMEIPITEKVVWEPFLRFEGLDWQDFGLTARVRL